MPRDVIRETIEEVTPRAVRSRRRGSVSERTRRYKRTMARTPVRTAMARAKSQDYPKLRNKKPLRSPSSRR